MDERSPLADAATALYALVPGEFVSARDARAREARAAKDRELATALTALKRPAAAAWVVNALVRAHPGAVAELLALGEELRAAQSALAGDELRRLGREQRAALAAARSLASDVADDAGQPLTEATWRQAEGTLRAAMADADAAAAVRSGRLVEPLEPTGFGEVDVSGAVAVPEAPALLTAARPTAPRQPSPSTAPAPGRAGEERRRPPGRQASGSAARTRVERGDGSRERAEQERAEREDAERERAAAQAAELAEAERAADDARRAAEVARAAAEDLTARRAAIAARLAELAAETDALRGEDRTLSRDEHAARAAVTEAERRAQAAERALQALRRRAGPPAVGSPS